MSRTAIDPIEQQWTPSNVDLVGGPQATASQVNERLSRIEVAELDQKVVPFLAAAAAELAMLADIPWRFGADDAPVALLRMIAKVTMRQPGAGGPHTSRLLQRLDR